MPKKWIPLESNPEVMTEFAGRIGLDTQQHAFHDIYGLDEEVRWQWQPPCVHAPLPLPCRTSWCACM